MEPKDLLEAAFDASSTNLDEQLQVVIDGRVACCIALTATFYFTRDQAEARARIADSFARYRATTDSRLLWGRNPKTRKLTKLARADWIFDVQSWLERLGPNESLEAEFHGGQQGGDASPYMFSSVSSRVATTNLSYVTLALPLAWATPKPPGSFVKFILSQCEALRPEHGRAGLGIVLPPGTGQTADRMQYAAMFALRFRGLDLSHAWWHANELGKQQKIKGADWLTALGDSWVSQLGGRNAVADALGSEVLLHDYPGGVLLEAGAAPQVGDVQRGEPMPHYERVAKLLRSIRATTISALAPFHGLDVERTADWLARFEP